MRKIILFLLLAYFGKNLVFAQATSFYEAPLYDNSTSTGRGPNGTSAHAYMSACGLVLASELTSIAPGTTLTSFGFTLNSGAVGTSPTGNFTVYLQNTTDVTYSKGTAFIPALAGMTSVYANTLNIPIAATSISITVTLSTPFIYTGGGLYVAYDYYNPGPYSTTAAIYRCNSLGLVPGLASGASTSTNVTTLATTAFRPCFLFGVANTYTNEIQVIGMEAPGRVAGMFNTAHNIVSVIKNSSNITKTNIPVTLNVSGANTFNNTQTITSLASGAITSVTFAAFNPTLGGLNTLSVSLPPDQVNTNNASTFNQSVTCNEWAINPAAVSYTMGSVGFNTGSGIIAVTYTNPIASTILALRGSISTNTASIGNSSWGVLLSSSGATIATTNTITISNAMLGTFQTFSFTAPTNLLANTNYYLGFAQPANATLGYFPMGTYTTNYVHYLNYVTTTTVGGTPAPLTSNLGYFGIEAIFAPSIPITAPSQTINCGNLAVLSATTAGNYTWSTGPSNTSISVSPIINSTYTILTSNALCTAANVVSVTVNPFSMSITPNSSTLCAGQTLSLSAIGAATSYTWSSASGPPISGGSYTTVPSISGNFSVVGTSTNGCSNSALVFITVNPTPAISILSNTNTICLGNSVSLTASGALSYTWSNGVNTSTQVVTPSSSVTYTVSGTNTFNCTSDAVLSLTVNSFTPSISPSTSICLGNQAAITASGGASNSYTWSNGVTFFNVINVSPSVTTLYSVTAYGQSNNCLGSNSVILNILQNPTVTATANRSVMCKGENNVLTALGASTYSWSTGDATSTVLINPQTISTFSYIVTGTDSKGCLNTFTLTMKVNACTDINTQTAWPTGNLMIYPNPSKNEITLEIDQIVENLRFEVYNTIGQLILSKQIEQLTSKVDLQGQLPGIYLLKLWQGNQNLKSAKIIKE